MTAPHPATQLMQMGNFEQLAQMFNETKEDVPARLLFVQAVRDSIEIVQTNGYDGFLKHLFPVLLQSLVPPLDATPAQLASLPVTQGRCSFYENDEVQKVRNNVLEILNRLPMNDTMKQFATELLHVIIGVLKADNEDNAVICLRIIFDVHKNYGNTLEKEVQSFIDFFISLYANLDHSIDVNFVQSFKPEYEVTSTEPPALPPPAPPHPTLPNPVPPPPGTPAPVYPALPPLPKPKGDNPGRVLLRGVDSFKVLTESPLIVMLLFQVYSKFTEHNVHTLIPHMMRMLQASAPPPPAIVQQNLQAMTENPNVLPIPQTIRWKTLFGDMIAAQVKTLSFLTYVLRGFSDRMDQHSDVLGQCVINLLERCPHDAQASRKELLVATRHILATKFRTSFFPKIDLLLDADRDILIGKNRSQEILRPLAYTTLADLIHHVRDKLSLPQLQRVVYIFSRNLHDPTLPLGIQIGAARGMLNLVDHIYRTQERTQEAQQQASGQSQAPSDAARTTTTVQATQQQLEVGRNLLVRILWSLASKFETLKDLIPRKIEAYVAKLKKEIARAAEVKAQAAQAAAAAAAASGSKEEAALAAAAAAAKVQAENAAKEVPTSIQTSQPLSIPAPPEESPEDAIRDIKSLLHTMVVGLKAVVWCITNFRDASKRTIPFHEEETNIVCRLLENGMKALRIFSPSIPQSAIGGSSTGEKPASSREQQQSLHLPGNSHGEEKETLDHFASLFMVLDPRTFRDVFTMKIESLFAQIVSDAPKFSLLLIVQQFLSHAGTNPSSSASNQQALGLQLGQAGSNAPGAQSAGSIGVNRVFADILLNYLVKRMPDMSTPPAESNVSSVLLSLFRLVFASVTENESVLRPYINSIVTTALRLSGHVKHPLNYLSMLRALFRSIGGGKFEQLYKEFLPLLPELLSGLMKMQSKGTLSTRDISIELCLTVPARLSSLLPYIPILMKAVLLALQAADEQVIKLGLRTLEFWVDNLNPDYLYPHMCPVLNDLMRSLCSLLRPQPSPFGHTALNVLGKLGGRNRRFFIEKYTFQHKKHGVEDAWNVDLAWQATLAETGEPIFTPAGVPNNQTFSMTVDRMVEQARVLLLKDYPGPYNLQASQQIQSHPATPISYIPAPGDEAAMHHTTSSPASIMQQKLSQKYNAFLFLRSVLLSMLELRGDFAAFKASLPAIESAASKIERLRKQKEAEDKEREQKDQAMDESYTGPSPANAAPIVSVAATVAASAGAVTPAVPVFSRPMGPQPQGDAEGAAVAARFQHEATRAMFKSLVQSMIIAASDIYLKKFDVSSTATTGNGESEVEPFLAGLITHFAMVAVNLPASVSEIVNAQTAHLESVLVPLTPSSPPPPITPEEDARRKKEEAAAADSEARAFARAPNFETYHLDLGLFLDAMFQTLAEENRYWSSAAALALRHFISSFISLVGSEQAVKAPVISDLLGRFLHACYEDRWETRHAGIIGLSMLVSVLPPTWQQANSQEIIRALLFTFKDEPSGFGDLSNARAHSTLAQIVTASCLLAMEAWERRKAGAAEVEQAAEEDAAQMEVDGDGGMGLGGAPAGGEPQPTDAAPSQPDANADTAAGPLIRGESTAELNPANATNTDMDIHMRDATEDAAKATEGKEAEGGSGKKEKPDGDTAMAVDPLAPPAKDAFDEHKSPMIHALIGYMLHELYAPVAAVREEALKLFQILADTVHRPLASVLAPYRSKLLNPIRQKSLHSFPLAVRIGYISAATFSLSLPNPPMTVRDLKYLVQEVLNDQSEDANYGANHPSTRLLKQQLTTQLRVESIHLMSVAICTEDLISKNITDPNELAAVAREKKDLRENIIRIFFRSLMSRSAEVVKVAKKGLKAVIEREKLPKELLQQCLRPVLLNLADSRKLSAILLEGLSRLLELLSHCFNVTLGEKLLDHLRCFADQEALAKMRSDMLNAEREAIRSGNLAAQQAAAANKIRPEDEGKIAASIIELFHLLPPAPDNTGTKSSGTSSKFLEPLVKYTLALEEMLPLVQLSSGLPINAGYPPQPKLQDEEKEKEKKPEAPQPLTTAYTHSTDTGISSPYRPPLIKFLNTTAEKCCEYFLRTSLTSTKPRQMFLSILKDPNAAPVRKYLVSNPDLLTMWTFKWNETSAQLQKQQAAAAAAAAASAAANPPAASTAPADASSTSAPMDTSSSNATTSAQGTTAASSSSTTPSTSSSSTTGGAAGAAPAAATSTPAPPPPNPHEWDDRIVQGIEIALVLSSFHPEFLSAPSQAGHPTILEQLFQIWDSPQRQARLLREETYSSRETMENRPSDEYVSRLPYLDETRMLVECVLNHVRFNHGAVDCLWKLLSVFQTRSLTDFTFLLDFYRNEVATGFTTAEKRVVLRDFLQWFQHPPEWFPDPSTAEQIKTRAMRFIVVPMLKANLAQREQRRPKEEVPTFTGGEIESAQASAVPPTPASKQRALTTSDDMRDDVSQPDSAAGMSSAVSASSARPFVVPKGSFDVNDILDAEMLELIVRKLLSGAIDMHDEELKCELLRLATMLIRYLKGVLYENKQETIKFAYKHLKSDNPNTKHWAYVNVCRYIAEYPFPTVSDKIQDKAERDRLEKERIAMQRLTLQVYVALLKAYQLEYRPLVRKALDILMPKLPDRLPLPANHSTPTFVKWTRHIIIHEGHMMPQLTHIWMTIIRHPDLFYESRRNLVNQIVNSLNRLAIPATRTIEQRHLALDLAQLVVNWDKRAQKEAKEGPAKAGDGSIVKTENEDNEEAASKRLKIDSAAAPAGGLPIYRPEPIMTPMMIEMLTTFLVRLALTTCEHPETRSLSRRSIRLLREAMELWQNVTSGEYKMAYIEKILSTPADPQMIALYSTTLDVLQVLLKYHPPSFMLNSIHSLDKIMTQCLKATVSSIREGVCEIFTLVMTQFPIQAPRQPSEELNKFYRNARENIIQALKFCERQNSISMQIFLLQTILKHCPTFMDSNFPLVVKAVQKLAKDHINHLARQYQKPGSQITPEERQKYALLTETLRKGLQIIADRIGVVGEHKKAYIQTVFGLLDKSTDIQLLMDIMKTVTPWITSTPIPAPNPALPPAAVQANANGPAPMDVSGSNVPAPATNPDGTVNASAGGQPAPSSTSPTLAGLSALAGVDPNPPPGTVLSAKEQISFMIRMCRFDRFDSQEPLHKLLDIVLECFTAKALKPMEWLSKLQRVFMLGLRCRDQTYRDKFIALYHSHISPAVFDRLNYIFQLQDWENLSDSFWIIQTTDLLLSIIKAEEELVPSHAEVDVPTSNSRGSSANRRYNQITFPSFDPAYWKSPETIGKLQAQERTRVLVLAKQRAQKHAQGTVKTDADGDENMVATVGDEITTRRNILRNKKKRSHEEAFTAKGDVKKEKLLMEEVSYTPPSFSSSPEVFTILAPASDDELYFKNLLHVSDPHAFRDAMLSNQAQWFYSHANNPVSNLLEPMRDLIHTNTEFTARVWMSVLPHAWAKITHDQRQELVNPISSLLARDWHNRLPCDRDHLHPIQVLLQSFLYCHPTPAVAPELLRFLAKTYNSWHECIHMLEQRILYLGPEVPISANIPSYDALGYLYRELGEEDIWHGLWRRRVVSDYSHAALALEQFSMWPRAQDYLYTAMNKKHSGGEAAAAEIGPVGRSETICWEEEWVRCSKHLNQWEVLKDFAHQIGHMELTWESSWRLADWNTLREMCQKHGNAEIPNARLYQISLAIHDRTQAPPVAVGAPPPPVINDRDIDKMIDSTIQSSLREWQTYPAFVCNAHITMLQRFQRIVELNESGQLLTDMAAHHQATQNQPPGAPSRTNMPSMMKNHITTWKERLLNKWEELPVWSEILTWRCHMFNIILKTYAQGQETDPNFARLHDLPWTVIKLAQVARKQQLPAVCLQILSKIQQFQRLDANDMFTRLREQIKTCLQSPAELNASLNILSSTNLDYFNQEQKSEMFRLKGEALQHLGYGDESNCFPIEDHEILTTEGFMSYTQFRDSVAGGCTVSVACVRLDGRLEYHPCGADRLIVDADREHVLVHFEQVAMEATAKEQSTHIDIVATGNHRMWVKIAAEKQHDQVDQFSFRRADSLRDCTLPDGSVPQVQFLTNSSQGVRGLGADVSQLKAILRGLSCGNDSPAGGVIFTSCARSRDEIQLIALRAGYTSHWTRCPDGSGWIVSYSDIAAVARPALHCREEITHSKEVGTVWCVSVPTPEQLILVRRVQERDAKDGSILKASRPIVVGNTAFSSCLSICDNYGKGWASWASFCDRVFTLKKDVQWADHALVCYIQAISTKYKRATLNMARILFLLSFDSYGGPVIRAFQKFADHIPTWVWLMWIPQLLSSLARPEGSTVKVILSRLARGYPQSLYYTMRAYLIESRDVRQATGQFAAQAQQQQPPAATAAPQAPAVPTPTSTPADGASGAAEKKDENAMTDVAPAGGEGAAEKPAEPNPADASLANTSQAGFQGGTPAQLAKPPVPTQVQPLRGDAAAAEAASAEGEKSAAGAPATGAAPGGAGAAAPGAGASAPGAPAAEKKSDEQLRREREEAERHPPAHPNQSIVWVEEVINILRRSHPSLITEVEKMLDEFTRRFKPEPDEELLNAVHAVALKCLKQPYVQMDLIPSTIQATIERVCKKFFTTELIPSSTQRKHICFVQKYKQAFERDFMHSSMVDGRVVLNPNYPTTLTELIYRLKRWKTHLLYLIGCAANVAQRMEKLTPYLVRFQSWDIEVPGQFIHDREPDQPNHIVIQRFDPIVAVLHSHGFTNRRIAMMGDDGKPYYFFVQYQINHITRSDERMMQLYVLLNRLMRNYKETRKRHLVHHVPIVVPLTHRMRLAETDPGQVTLEDIYEESCRVRRVDSDQPLFIYRDHLKKLYSDPQMQQSSSQLVEARQNIYKDITNRVVPDSILSRFIHRTIPSNDQYWCFKAQFCSQLGLSGFLSYLMKIGERHLHRITMFKQNGRLINSEFYPTYNDSGIVESNEPVPFRLTRNLQQALSPTMIDGQFAAVIMAANSCLLTNQEVLKNYLSLFIRDDLLSWNNNKSPIDTDVRQRELEKQLREKVTQNTNMVLKRIHMLMPTPNQQPSAAERAAHAAAAAAAGHPVSHLANQPQPLNHKIHLLIKVATDMKKLSTMSPQWSPWF